MPARAAHHSACCCDREAVGRVRQVGEREAASSMKGVAELPKGTKARCLRPSSVRHRSREGGTAQGKGPLLER